MPPDNPGLAAKNCVPCDAGVARLTNAEIVPLLAQLEGWAVEDGTADVGHHLEKLYAFPDFVQALAFVNRVGAVAEEQGHHPDLCLSWGEVRLVILTHAIDGLTENDFILAARCDREFHPAPVARKQIWRADDPAHAHLLAGLLESHGIDVLVEGDELFAGEGGLLPSEAGPTLWVPVDDAARAHDVLTNHGPGAADES